MLQIRLSKGSSTDNAATVGGGGAGGAATVVGAPSVKTAAVGPGAAEGVTVACPDHLVIADLPVAKSIGAVIASATSAARTIGRRSRRPLGERVHICSRCDFPIAIYGRLVSTILSH
jgi:E3 ubiquitin-protein ligase Hakai